MGVTYRYIAQPSEPSEVLGWFASLPTPPTVVPTTRGAVLYFRECGALVSTSDGAIDAKASPVVTIFVPRVRRAILWTVGEVHFLATPLRRRYPALHKVSSAFSKWLGGFECVHSNKRTNNEFTYYLEGSVQNSDPPIYAFESGQRALLAGRYFVSDEDNDFVLDALCKKLRLREVQCGEGDPAVA